MCKQLNRQHVVLYKIGMFRHMLSCMSKTTRILSHLAVLCDSLRCGVYGNFLLWHIMKFNTVGEWVVLMWLLERVSAKLLLLSMVCVCLYRWEV